MNENSGQYISASKRPICAARLNDGWFDPYDVANREYSIIKTKGAHDISAFQKKMNSAYAAKEDEVAISRTARHRIVPEEEMTDEMKQAREEFASNLFRDAHKLFRGKTEVKGYTKEDLLNLVKVYEEI